MTATPPAEKALSRRLRRNIFAWLWRIVVAYAVLFTMLDLLDSWAGEDPGLLELFGGLFLGTVLAMSVVQPLWWRFAGPWFGVPTHSLVQGMGGIRSVQYRGDLLVVRRSHAPWLRSVLPAPQAEGASRLRIWAAYALQLVVLVGVAAALVPALPGTWGFSTAKGFLIAAIVGYAFLPFRGASAVSSWVFFCLPFAKNHALAHITNSRAARTAERLLMQEGPDAARAALPIPDDRLPSDEVLAIEIELAAGDYKAALHLARSARLRHAEGLWFASLFAQQAVRAVAYAREAGQAIDAEFSDAYELADLAVAAVAHPIVAIYSDGTALSRMSTGDHKRAMKAIKNARKRTLRPIVAAHIECTAAVFDLLGGRPDQARQALDRARSLAPGLHRIDTVAQLLAPARTGLHSTTDPVLDMPA
ncbi:hypothetical protein [Yinghuangia soli]|uniref:Uncharacterized protein n=1 Tax=Yinghuangia soli TaxID=2908204 RepID=A0AA41U3P8_9ACTN|nr:hypothetical protein [Yinghuangia soli]MCF2532963.1 hypothetical protein [Yinghuangia soli]